MPAILENNSTIIFNLIKALITWTWTETYVPKTTCWPFQNVMKWCMQFIMLGFMFPIIQNISQDVLAIVKVCKL